MTHRYLYTATALLISITLTGCSFFNGFFKKESTYYNKSEIKILQETTSAIFYNYGFDGETELDYIYSEVPKIEDAKSKKNEIKTVLQRYKKDEAIAFYKKIYALRLKMERAVIEYKQDEEWKKYTYVKKYLLPPMNIYINLLKESLKSLYPDAALKGIEISKKEKVEKK